LMIYLSILKGDKATLRDAGQNFERMVKTKK